MPVASVRFLSPKVVPPHSLITTVFEIHGCCVASSNPRQHSIVVSAKNLSRLGCSYSNLASFHLPPCYQFTGPVTRRNWSGRPAVPGREHPASALARLRSKHSRRESGPGSGGVSFPSGWPPVSTSKLTRRLNENTRHLEVVGRRQH